MALRFLIVCAERAIAGAACEVRLVRDLQDGAEPHFGAVNLDWARLGVLFAVASLREETIFRGYFFLLPLWITLSIKDKLAGWAVRDKDGQHSHLETEKPGDAAERRPVPGIRASRLSPVVIAFLIIQAAVFSAMHSGNPHITTLAFANIFIAGVMFGLLAIIRGGFYIAWGAHFGFNFAYEAYNLPVSGIVFETGARGWGIELAEGGAFGGGSFGLEAGLACTAVLAFFVLLLFWRKPADQ